MTSRWPRLPVRWHPAGTDEFLPAPPTGAMEEAARRAAEDVERTARRLGVPRRRFLHSLGASAACLLARDACSRDEHRARTGGEPGGRYRLPRSLDRTRRRPGGDRVTAAVELGVPIVAVHKGFGGGSGFASPVDIGTAAARHQDVSFVVYHSGYEAGVIEGPYDETGAGRDRLIRTLRRHPETTKKVYAELGATWRQVMGRPTRRLTHPSPPKSARSSATEATQRAEFAERGDLRRTSSGRSSPPGR